MEAEKFYTIGEAAALAGTTIETLRHYDRIGLLKPAKTEPGSRYRYYTDTELVYLEVIAFCRRNKMPLAQVRTLLHADFPQAVAFLQAAEAKIDGELERLSRARAQISSLRASLQGYPVAGEARACAKHLERRAIVVAEGLHEATVDNFRRLHQQAYEALAPAAREAFAFDHSANILLPAAAEGKGTMFAVCTRYCADPALRFLGAGEYLCCPCGEENKQETLERLWRAARERRRREPRAAILNVQFIGLFQWRYEAQVPLF